MQSTAYYTQHQGERRASRQVERRVSLSKLSVVLASFALWAALIGGVALVVG